MGVGRRPLIRSESRILRVLKARVSRSGGVRRGSGSRISLHGLLESTHFPDFVHLASVFDFELLTCVSFNVNFFQ